ncbi:hypothetical protein [uncultured Lacinutrix sp.]|uniref:hypothetical protein n=1 Tax=uncultured Lacinutrix sp. TaxID=574032 RepID=UPI00261A1E1A|nr:hypothetical protein [uncultured Lacinutrix sp.]
MKKATLLSIVITCILFFGCKNETQKIENIEELNQIPQKEKDPLDSITEIQEKDLANAYFYVLAPNGLLLRKSDNLNSEKILTIPFGEKVKQKSLIYTANLTVENIHGSMMEVIYNGVTGYVFSGFLSPFAMPIKEEPIKDYINRLKEVHSNISFKENPTDPDFHEGTEETITLPTKNWHEAFYIAKASYNIPLSLIFPGHNGLKKETINQEDKEDYIWSSVLMVSRNEKKLDTIQYNWRTEGGGYWVTITKPVANQFKIEYTGFAD